MRYPDDSLREAVSKSTSVAGVLRYLGIAQSGGMHAHISRRIKRLDLDTSHFTGQAHNRGKRLERKPASEILIIRPPGSNRAKPHQLRRALCEVGRAYICEECGIGDAWNGRPLTLHVDHINGDYRDCREINLRFLCPNCHSQTVNFAGRARFGAREVAGAMRPPACSASRARRLDRLPIRYLRH